jgi:hypothetical protein
MSKSYEYCNWEFRDCLTPKEKWVLKRDCDEDETTITRGSVNKWNAYKQSLEPILVGSEPRGVCPTCRKYINGVNPYDDGETWRR